MMKLLAIFVALFAVLAAGAGFKTSQNAILILSGASLLCAYTTFRAAGISSFLKIFAAIFAIENIVFGLVHLASKLGFWPAALSDYLPPESLPLTVAIFAILVFAISHISVVRSMTQIADRYFDNGDQGTARIWPFATFPALERRIAVAMVVFLVLVNQAQVGIMVRLSFFNRDWFNAIQEKNEPLFWQLLLWVFVPWAFIYVASAIIEFVVQSMLIIRWRKWLTNHYVGRWLDGDTHYRMTLVGTEADNPDQRIAEDVNRFINGGEAGYGLYSYSILLISTVSTLVSFAIVLWGLSSNFTLPGTTIAVPGFLFWVALIYAAIGTLITHLIGRPLVRLSFARQRYEADFRFSLARLREYGEQVALLSGDKAEKASLSSRFGNIISNYLSIVDRRKKLMAFTASYGQISPIIPYIFTAPFYFLGKIQLGVMTQTAGAFSRVEGALTFFITYYTSLADFKAVLDRLTSFDGAIDKVHADEAREPRIVIKPVAADQAIGVENLDLSLPDGRQIVANTNLTWAPGKSILVTGPSGSGKSTLFRAIAGIWPYGKGVISAPQAPDILLLPQKPYIPIGTLRSAVTYPAVAGAFSDAEIAAALTAAHLPKLAESLDASDVWSQRLSGGEQQRLAIARAMLAKPAWLFLDEATAAMDEKMESAIYVLLAEKLPNTTIVSIGHRSTLLQYHAARVDMVPQDDGTFTPKLV